ncbi:MAG: helix-turn-helix transcriptional regulator [Myxococcota bacterium]
MAASLRLERLRQPKVPAGYVEHDVSDAIVEAAWTSRATSDAAHPVLPDGRADLILRFRSNTVIPIISLPKPNLLRVAIRTGDTYVGLRLRPGYLAAFGAPLTGRAEGQAVLETLGELAHFDCAAQDGFEFVTEFSRWLAAKRSVEVPEELLAALDAIDSSQGRVSVHDLERRLQFNRRRIHRYFLRYVGLSPKAYTGVVRFQNALRQLHKGSPIADVAYTSGYSDQAHMTRAFRRLSGQTPARLTGLRRRQE